MYCAIIFLWKQFLLLFYAASAKSSPAPPCLSLLWIPLTVCCHMCWLYFFLRRAPVSYTIPKGAAVIWKMPFTAFFVAMAIDATLFAADATESARCIGVSTRAPTRAPPLSLSPVLSCSHLFPSQDIWDELLSFWGVCFIIEKVKDYQGVIALLLHFKNRRWESQ